MARLLQQTLFYLCVQVTTVHALSSSSKSGPCLHRRSFFLASSSACATVLAPRIVVPTARAAGKPFFVQGSVTLTPEATVVELEGQPTSALYITCRPDRADNVPAAILSGTRGKPPPVLAARFENPNFPYSFQLDVENLTPEGADGGGDGETGFWWSNDDLIVSGRWDADGVAATRSPEDLVGRAILAQKNGKDVTLQLQGRGSFGKFATKKN